MTIEEATTKKAELECFYCYANLDRYPNILIISSLNGVVEIKNQRQKIVPMVYCSSDCMYFESHLRYQSRVIDGSFRRVEPREMRMDQLPERWQGEGDKLIGGSNV